MRTLTTWEVWRPQAIPDGLGGQSVTMVQVGTERGDVRELTGRERFEAQQSGADHSHSCFFRLRANIARNDELRRGDDVLTVVSVADTFPPTRLRVGAKSEEGGD